MALESNLARLGVDLASSGARQDDVSAFMGGALAQIGAALQAELVAVAAAQGGQFVAVRRWGTQRALPRDLLSDVSDRDVAKVEGPWAAVPLERSGELLVAHFGDRKSPPGAETLAQTATGFAAGLEAARAGEKKRRRIERLEAVLRIAAQWNQTTQMEPLLKQMAEAATRLLRADRASIFLWDRDSHTLVARPALGVEHGELRIPDDAGIVGQVIQTGEPRRVNSAMDEGEINRKIDSQLGYQTRTLLCVPLRGSRGELFGAFEVINKLEGTFGDEDEAALTELAAHAAIALENTRQLEDLVATNRQIVEQAARSVQLIGESPAVQHLRATIDRVAGTELAVLVLGENGTGKEVVSQLVHYGSRRRNRPFVAVNCAAISETLLESELFGHEKGAFTDAHEMRQGKFEVASGGTLFLDEIGDLSAAGQAKLLRVLEEKVVVRVGGSKPIHTDARVIAATNQNLADMVRQKRFRQDLFFRLNVVTLDLPALRDRGEDVLLLAEDFLVDFCRKARRKPLKIAGSARKRMLMHNWPGNVRELRNLMERLAYLLPGDKIEEEDLAPAMTHGDPQQALIDPDLPLSSATDRFQIEFIKKTIDRSRGNMSEAAERLGLHRSNLYRKMRQLGMHTGE